MQADTRDVDPRDDTRYDPAKYFQHTFGWSPWRGTPDQPGQQEVIDAYVLAIRQQYEKRDFENGKIKRKDLKYWQPGQAIKRILRIEAGHTTGKSKLAAGLVSHFFDHFEPGVTYTFAPTWAQISDLLWKYIATDRGSRPDLPGRVMATCALVDDFNPSHFAKGKATNDAGGKGTERVQGQHEEHNLYVIDEAEGVADFLYDALDSMTSGGISVIIMLANPKTRTSRFFKIKARPDVCNFRISCLFHPNVIQGREVVPGAIKRDYVDLMIEEHCSEVDKHYPDDFTFSVPWRPGKIYLPDSEMLFRVLGIPPLTTADRCFVPVGRYEAAVNREAIPAPDARVARIGVDVARGGADHGTVYVRWNGRAWRAAKLSKLVTQDYTDAIKKLLRELHTSGVIDVQIRVDAGGGWGSGVIDNLRIDDEMIQMFHRYLVLECHFNGSPTDKAKWYDSATEWTADVAETLKTLSVLNPPPELMEDLTERPYDFRNRQGIEVKKLIEKPEFKKDKGRSPDDGDGFILAVASDFLFNNYHEPIAPEGIDRISPWAIGEGMDGDDEYGT